jgi:hypothetical protein
MDSQNYRQVACKVIKTKDNKKDLDSLLKEVRILEKLKHVRAVLNNGTYELTYYHIAQHQWCDRYPSTYGAVAISVTISLLYFAMCT